MSSRVRTGPGREPVKNPKEESMIKDVFWLLVNVPFRKAMTREEIWKALGSPVNDEGEPLSTPGACASKLKNEKALFEVPGSRPQRFYGLPMLTDDTLAQNNKIRVTLSEKNQEACWIARGLRPPTPLVESPDTVEMFSENSEDEQAEEPETSPEPATPVDHSGECTAEAREKTFEALQELPRGHFWSPEKIAEEMGFDATHVSTNLSYLYREEARVVRQKVGRKYHYGLRLLEGTPDDVLDPKSPEPEAPVEAPSVDTSEVDELIFFYQDQEIQLQEVLANVQRTLKILQQAKAQLLED